MEKRKQTLSFLGVILLTLLLPLILRVANGVVRYFAGASVRLAAITVETDRVLGPLPRVWTGLAQGGEDLATFLEGRVEKVGEVKPAYIRIDHIYDQFDVVGRSGNQLTYNWKGLDAVVGRILETGAKPFFSLSYMPPVVAKTDIVSEPNDWNEWAQVVEKTIERYSGEKAITDVYYEVWNEPDLFGSWKMGGNKDYKNLYLFAAKGAEKARVATDFKFGGPATTGLYKNWVDNFFPFVLRNKLRLDFISWHRYDLDLDKYAADVTAVDKWIEGNPYFSKVEKIVSEMGPSSERGGVNDNEVGAAHLVAVSRELMYKVKYEMSFAIWGSFGLLDKPRHKSLLLLTSLGKDRLGLTGEGSYVRAIGAKKGEVYQVLLVNYDPKGRHTEMVPVSFINLPERNFVLRTTILGEKPWEAEVASTEAILQSQVAMLPNKVVLLELVPVP